MSRRLGPRMKPVSPTRVRREVVVVDVALLVLDAEAVDALELAGAAQREQAHGLRLAAREEGAAVRARDDARPRSVIGRISSVARPSGRRFSTAMRRRMMSFSSLATARLTCTARSASVSSVDELARTTALLDLGGRVHGAPSCRAPGWRRRRRRRSRCGPRRARLRRRSTQGTSHLGLPTSFCSSSCTATSFLISSCASSQASTTTALGDLLGAGLDHARWRRRCR